MSPEWEEEETKAWCKEGGQPDKPKGDRDNHNPGRDREGQSMRESKQSQIVKTTRSLDASLNGRAGSRGIKTRALLSGTRQSTKSISVHSHS